MSFYRNRNKGLRYLGGKGKCGEIVRIINDLLPCDGIFWDAMTGSAKIVQNVKAGVRYASDIDPNVMCLHKAVQNGWEPPDRVTEEEYRRCMKLAKKGKITPHIAFVGYACSFGARWYQGYARSKGKWDVNFAASSRRSILRQRPFLEGVKFYLGDYRKVWERLVTPHVIYCDIPYKGTKPVGCMAEPFDHNVFWEWAQERAEESIVLISEYTCPVKHAVVIWEKSVASGIRFGTKGDGGNKGSGKRKQEKLFTLNPDVVDRLGFGI